MIRTHFELVQIPTFEERFQYLSLAGRPGEETFGYDRYLNQKFYRSAEWRRVRNIVITRDLGCDLAFPGMEIHSKLLIHHMNPMRKGFDILESLDPEFLITTTHRTHNAIHYGDEELLMKVPKPRTPGDTKLW